MQFDKSQILQLLQSRGDQGAAQRAEAELPDRVDTEQHAGLLSTLGLDPQDVIAMLTGGTGGPGGLGGLAGKLGL